MTPDVQVQPPVQTSIPLVVITDQLVLAGVAACPCGNGLAVSSNGLCEVCQAD